MSETMKKEKGIRKTTEKKNREKDINGKSSV
jgi:hypothetical protein